MIVQKSFLNKLKDFGLNTYESKLWTALLSRGVSTAGELSDIANVPRSRSYDVLESLEKKGFIIMKLGKPIKYIAVPPSEVIERVKKQISDDALRHTEMLDSLQGSQVLNELNSLHQQGIDMVEPTELTAHVKGRQNMINQIESMVKNSTTVDIITTESAFEKKAEIIKKAAKKAKKQPKIRIITQPTKRNKEIAKSLKDLAEVRFSEKIHGRMALADRANATLMLVPHKKTHPDFDTGVWVSSPFLSATLHDLFDHAWESSQS